MPSEQDIRRNMQVVGNAIAQQRLEGLEPSSALVADLERVARGEISIDHVIENIKQRFRHAEIREPRPLS
ncbi:MAG: antitoxin VbhA family protein [Deltaproteobacteria bacterium]|nr:antitoxin VbhA family protein [Deltaproteobacteria bacterium]